MAVIINYADMLPELVDDPDVEMASGKIVSMGRGLTELGTKAGKIEQAFQSAEDGLRPVDLRPIVEQTVEEMRTDHELEVSVSLAHSTEVLALSTIAMAIENICANAIDHNTHPEPVVEITAGAVAVDPESNATADRPTENSDPDTATPNTTEERLRLTVADNGPGIPDQEINVLTAGRETALEHGSGLGLWLVYWLAEKSEADLEFDDAELGGAAVSLVFKLPPTDDEQPKDTTDTDSDKPGESQ